MRQKLVAMLTAVVGLVALVALTPAYAVVVTNTADSWTRSTAQDDNYGTHENITSHYRSDGFIAKGYMRFDISAMSGVVGSATLSLVFCSNTRGDAGDVFVINVYGLDDGTTGETTWIESGAGSITWNNAPGEPDNTPADNVFTNATLLGTIDVNIDDGIGTEYTLSSAALVTFLNADSNDEVTIMLAARDANNDSEGIGFASLDHATYAAPTLEVLPQSNETELDAVADSHIRSHSTVINTTHGDATAFLINNQGSGNTGKAYMRFNIVQQVKPVGKTTLSLVHAAGANFDAGETLVHHVYGVDDGTAGETVWTEADMTWNNALQTSTGPSNADWIGLTNVTSLGTITLDGDNALGTTYTLSTSELSAFLNADNNDQITIIVVQETQRSEWAGYATKEHATYAAPHLSAAVPKGTVIVIK